MLRRFSSFTTPHRLRQSSLSLSTTLLPMRRVMMNNSSSSVTSDDDGPDFASMQTVSASDAFAKPRVTNYLKRTPYAFSGFKSTKITAMSLDGASSSSSSSTWYRCAARIPILFSNNDVGASNSSTPERVANAIGFAKTEKDAENACAMHAERILDSAGVEMFSLGAMQTRHAEAAIKDGRWARYPKNHPKRKQQDEEARRRRECIPTTPPLIFSAEGKSDTKKKNNLDRNSSSATSKSSSYADSDIIEITLEDTKGSDDSEMQHEGIEIDKAEHADWRIFPHNVPLHPPPSSKKHLDESEGGKYWLTEFGMYYENDKLTLLTPHCFCAEARGRIEKYFAHFGKSFEKEIVESPLLLAAWGSERVNLVKTSVKIPIKKKSTTPDEKQKEENSECCFLKDDEGNFVEAHGVSKDKDRGISLLAMHLELLIDYHGLELFPYDPKLQKQHSEECAKLGRWATSGVGGGGGENDDKKLSSSTKSIEEGQNQYANGINNNRRRPPIKGGLREWGDSTKPKTSRGFGRSVQQAKRVAPLTEEEFFLHCHARNVRPYHLLEFNPADLMSDGKGEQLLQDLHNLFKEKGERREQFFLNLDYGSMWRCTFLLPLCMKTYGIRGGYALGFTQFEARVLAAQHAIETLCMFGLPLYPNDKKKQEEFEQERRRRGQFVVDRDPQSGEILNPASPKARSPPGYRSMYNAKERKRALEALVNIEQESKIRPKPVVVLQQKDGDEGIGEAVVGEENSSSSSHHQHSESNDNNANDLLQVLNIAKGHGDAFNRAARDYDDGDVKLFSSATCMRVRNSTQIPRYIDWRAAQMIDANQFTTLDFRTGDTFDRFVVGCLELYLRNVYELLGYDKKDDSHALRLQQYYGIQPVNGHFIVNCNTVFASIPLPPDVSKTQFEGAATIYAVGRDEERKVATKNFYIHAMKIIHHLGLLYMCIDRSESGNTFYNDLGKITERVEKLFQATKVTTQIASTQQQGIHHSFDGVEFAFGANPEQLCAPIHPLDKDGNPMTSEERAKMVYVPCPCTGPTIASRCFTQSTGLTRHRKFKCA